MSDDISMIERVAKAIYESRPGPEYWDGSPAPRIRWKQFPIGHYDRNSWLASAHAAVAAMREPTEAMLESMFAETAHDRPMNQLDRVMLIMIWIAGINKALEQ